MSVPRTAPGLVLSGTGVQTKPTQGLVCNNTQDALLRVTVDKLRIFIHIGGTFVLFQKSAAGRSG